MNDADTGVTFADRYGPWALVLGASDGVGAEYAGVGDLRHARLLHNTVRAARVLAGRSADESPLSLSGPGHPVLKAS